MTACFAGFLCTEAIMCGHQLLIATSSFGLRLKEFPLSAIADRLEVGCHLNATDGL